MNQSVCRERGNSPKKGRAVSYTGRRKRKRKRNETEKKRKTKNIYMLLWLVGGGQEQIWIRSGLDSTRLDSVVWCGGRRKWCVREVVRSTRWLSKMVFRGEFATGMESRRHPKTVGLIKAKFSIFS